ncbi:MULTISPECIES: ribonuclease Z [unclassified Granulicatella]|uniref:ribonuclease Z n=1 Tax=unclassified Granulicatella TaxID=2630493 RepID=UPI001073431C|nr:MULTISPECIES: ribonuclease Z [unclassified Granulicatella]MBF0780715.1 ribonuclease Z [Granulicatella sp. 19428wC4_WM01]TFU94208.1 ribonuclease Z [Granulicatella sp. WM01]
MQLQFLGTGAGIPAKHRNVSSIALKMLDERNEIWLFDCGEATQHTILHTSIRPRKITKIFITHLHGDHIFGLPGFLSSRAFQGGEEPLTIFGPVGIKEYVQTALRISHSHLKYALHIVELAQEGIAYQDKQIKVVYQTLKHGIQSYGYKVIESDLDGELQADKLKDLGIPSGPIYGQLKKGEQVTLEDGRIINGLDFVGPSRKGRQVVIFGDTRYFAQHAEFCKYANVLVHEATFGRGEEQMAYHYFHSTCTQAAEIAKFAQVSQLYLTHISSRYLAHDAKQLEKDAQKVFSATQIAHDLLEVDIPFHD